MKKVILMACVFLFFAVNPLYGQVADWRVANQITFEWTAPTELDNENDDLIPAGDTLEYEIYCIKFDTDKATIDLANPQLIVTENEATVTFNLGEGKYIVGVRAIRIPEGESERIPSSVVWSDDPASVAAETFGGKFWHPTKLPTALK